MSNNTNGQESKSNLVEILEQLIKVFKADVPEKRTKVAKRAAMNLLGVGALVAMDYIINKHSKE